jgi:hypothetical protein
MPIPFARIGLYLKECVVCHAWCSPQARRGLQVEILFALIEAMHLERALAMVPLRPRRRRARRGDATDARSAA